MYFDYLLDESYTPSKIVISAGTGLYDLTEVKTIELREPRGWQTVNVGEFGREYHHPHSHFQHKLICRSVIKAFLVQISILANHQNGKDTHLRGVKIFAPGQPYRSQTSMDEPSLDQSIDRMFSIR
jgi:anaphase-promoting complex subunit 10